MSENGEPSAPTAGGEGGQSEYIKLKVVGQVWWCYLFCRADL